MNLPFGWVLSRRRLRSKADLEWFDGIVDLGERRGLSRLALALHLKGLLTPEIKREIEDIKPPLPRIGTEGPRP